MAEFLEYVGKGLMVVLGLILCWFLLSILTDEDDDYYSY